MHSYCESLHAKFAFSLLEEHISTCNLSLYWGPEAFGQSHHETLICKSIVLHNTGIRCMHIGNLLHSSWGMDFFLRCCMNRHSTVSYTLIPTRFPRIEGASGNVSQQHTSRSSWLISRTEWEQCNVQTKTETRGLTPWKHDLSVDRSTGSCYLIMQYSDAANPCHATLLMNGLTPQLTE